MVKAIATLTMALIGLYFIWCATLLAPSMTYPHSDVERIATAFLFGGLACVMQAVVILTSKRRA